MITLRRPRGGQRAGQECADGLKSRLQLVEPPHESLIRGQAREPVMPILENKVMHLLLLEAALAVSKEPDGNDLLVSELRLAVIAQALKAGRGRSIVDVTGKQVEVNQ